MNLLLAILGSVAVIGAAAAFINGSLGHRHMTFATERYATGALPDEIGRELRLRMAAASLRRRASHAVARSPGRHAEIIRQMAKEEGLRIAAFDKSMARQFLRWAEAAELTEILYPAAMIAVWKARKQRKVRPMHHDARRDLHAALRVSG